MRHTIPDREAGLAADARHFATQRLLDAFPVASTSDKLLLSIAISELHPPESAEHKLASELARALRDLEASTLPGVLDANSLTTL